MNIRYRKPDFVLSGSTHEFWIYPEMIWRHNVSSYSAYEWTLKEENGHLMCNTTNGWEKVWDSAQNEYKAYKLRLDQQLDEILLND